MGPSCPQASVAAAPARSDTILIKRIAGARRARTARRRAALASKAASAAPRGPGPAGADCCAPSSLRRARRTHARAPAHTHRGWHTRGQRTRQQACVHGVAGGQTQLAPAGVRRGRGGSGRRDGCHGAAARGRRRALPAQHPCERAALVLVQRRAQVCASMQYAACITLEEEVAVTRNLQFNN